MRQQYIANNISEHGLIPLIFKADVMKYSEENILKELAALDARKVELLKLLEYGIDSSKYYLTTDILKTIKSKFPFFYSNSIMSSNKVIIYNLGGVSMDVESHRLRTPGGAGTIYYTLPVYSYKITQGDASLSITNATKQYLDIDKAWKISLRRDNGGTIFLNSNKNKRLSAQVDSLTANTSFIFTFNLRSGIKTHYKHPHSSSQTSTFNASICTGSENRFITLATTSDKIKDIYTYQVFLDGMLFWLQSINLSDCYGTYMAPERSIVNPIFQTNEENNEYQHNMELVDEYTATQHLYINKMLDSLYQETKWKNTWDNTIFGGKTNKSINSTMDVLEFITTNYDSNSWSTDELQEVNNQAIKLIKDERFIHLVGKTEEALDKFFYNLNTTLTDDIFSTLSKVSFLKLTENSMYYNMPQIALINTLDAMQDYTPKHTNPEYSFFKIINELKKLESVEEIGSVYNQRIGMEVYSRLINLQAEISLMEIYRHLFNTYLMYRFMNFGVISSEISRDHLLKNVIIEDLMHFTNYRLDHHLFNNAYSISSSRSSLSPYRQINTDHMKYVALYPQRLEAANKFYTVNSGICRNVDRTTTKNMIQSFNFREQSNA